MFLRGWFETMQYAAERIMLKTTMLSRMTIPNLIAL
jgi:hypothetical protein